ncbi:hypothetical protein [Rhodococcoides fascians]|uniref:hypothetical protein n=1 Tax=Rhodococcoides fascians TaxID=1828 RepID=UPI00050CAFC4|nr:hypothetical protein [Rhodococcus fascians]
MTKQSDREHQKLLHKIDDAKFSLERAQRAIDGNTTQADRAYGSPFGAPGAGGLGDVFDAFFGGRK